MNYKSIISTLALIALILPLVAPVLQIIPMTTAQIPTPAITNIYGAVKFDGQLGVYPGSTIVVEVFTPHTFPQTIEIFHAENPSTVYETQTFTPPPQGGYVNVTVTIPKVLFNLTYATEILGVRLIAGPSTYGFNKNLSVLPALEVVPSTSTIVDANENPQYITVYGYGFPYGTIVKQVRFTDALGNLMGTVSGTWVSDFNGVVRITIPLTALNNGKGLPKGTYKVNVTLAEPVDSLAPTSLSFANVPRGTTLVLQNTMAPTLYNLATSIKLDASSAGAPNPHTNVTITITGPDGVAVKHFYSNRTGIANLTCSETDGHWICSKIGSITYTPFSLTYSFEYNVTAGRFKKFDLEIAYEPRGLALISYVKTASLTIRPQAVITPSAGNGIYVPDAMQGDIGRDVINVKLYGFPAGSVITRIQLVNTNFTGVYYEFKLGRNNKTDTFGYFAISDITRFNRTNMTAGLYIPVVYYAPSPIVGTNETPANVPLGQLSWVAYDLEALGVPGLTGVVNSTFQVNGSLGYISYATKQNVSKTYVLNIDLVNATFTYELAANMHYIAAEDKVYARFVLYNTTIFPPITVFTYDVPTTFDSSIGANVSCTVYFDFRPTGVAHTKVCPGDIPPAPGTYKYRATFYEYPNRIYLLVEEYRLVLDAARVTITYSETGESATFTLDNMTVVGTSVELKTPWKFTVDDKTVEVSWSYEAEGKATIKVTVTMKETYEEFRNAYYLVRPILAFLVGGKLYKDYPGAVMPGANITLVAFGYSPGKAWCDLLPDAPWCAVVKENVLRVTLDMITYLWSGPLGRDGNVTFVVTLPRNVTWGAHYIHGIDSRGYEYSVAIVIGAKAVFLVVLRPENYTVSASYYNTHIDACPCALYEGKTFCDICVVYTGDCDYLGDYVQVTVYGLQPGEKLVRLYLNDVVVPSELINGTLTADSEGKLTFWFLVPSLPQGIYRIRVITSIAGERVAVWEKNTTIDFIEIKPKLLLVSLESNLTAGNAILPILVGSGMVRVIGTGFKPGVTMDSIIVNMTDAMRTILTNVRYWSVDEKGILVGSKFAGQDIYPALLFPVMQPGKYEIKLAYYDGATPLLSDPGFIFVVNNLTFVATVDDVKKVADTVSAGVSEMKTFLNTTMTQLVSQITTALGTLASKSDVDRILAAVGDVRSAVVSVNSSVATVSSKVDTAVTTITGALTSLRTDLSGSILAVAGKVDTILNKVTVIYDNVTMIGIKIEKLDNVVAKLDSVASQLAGAVSNINALSSKLDELSRKVDASAGDVKGAVSDVRSAVNALSGKVDVVSSKVDNAAGTATNGMYVGVLALVFALLAMIFALLAYNTIRKSVAPK